MTINAKNVRIVRDAVQAFAWEHGVVKSTDRGLLLFVPEIAATTIYLHNPQIVEDRAALQGAIESIYQDETQGCWYTEQTIAAAIWDAYRTHGPGIPEQHRKTLHKVVAFFTTSLFDGMRQQHPAWYGSAVAPIITGAALAMHTCTVCESPDQMFEAFGYPGWHFSTLESFQRFMDEMFDVGSLFYDEETNKVVLFPSHPHFESARGALMLASIDGTIAPAD